MCDKFNSLFDIEMKVYYVTEVFKQGSNIKMMGPNYTFKLTNTKSH